MYVFKQLPYHTTHVQLQIAKKTLHRYVSLADAGLWIWLGSWNPTYWLFGVPKMKCFASCWNQVVNNAMPRLFRCVLVPGAPAFHLPYLARINCGCCGFSLSHSLWPQNFHISRMKNQHGHWVYWYRWVERTFWCEDNTHMSSVQRAQHTPASNPDTLREKPKAKKNEKRKEKRNEKAKKKKKKRETKNKTKEKRNEKWYVI